MQTSSRTGGRAAGKASASQPGDASSGARGSASASQPGQTTIKSTVLLQLGSYNFGVQQNKLESATAFRGLCKALCTIVADAVEFAELDLFFGNEVGGHREGLPAARLEYRDVLAPAFGTDVHAEALQNYTAAWNLGRRISEAPVLHKKKSEVITLQSSRFTQGCVAIDPQLAMWVFEVMDHSKAHFGFLIVGCLHVT